MSELATKNRAEALAEAIVRNVPRLPHCYDELTEALGVSEASVQYECDLAELIEQALLRERRLAMKWAAQFVADGANGWAGRDFREQIADAIRAAAEKEVAK